MATRLLAALRKPSMQRRNPTAGRERRISYGNTQPPYKRIRLRPYQWRVDYSQGIQARSERTTKTEERIIIKGLTAKLDGQYYLIVISDRLEEG